MLGAVVGDIVGSPFEFDQNRKAAYSRKYPLISEYSIFTDDSVMTLAIVDALMKVMPNKGDKCSEADFEKQAIASMQAFGRSYVSLCMKDITGCLANTLMPIS